MKKVATIFLVIVLLAPVLYGVAYVMFPSVRPTPSSKELFKRLTGLQQLPESVSDLKTHSLFDPLLGDGHAIISFTADSSDGAALTEGIKFRKYLPREGERMPVEIVDPQSGGYLEELREGTIITNPSRTTFLWAGSI